MKHQWLAITVACLLLITLYFLGRTKPHAKDNDKVSLDGASSVFSTEKLLATAKKSLKPDQISRIQHLENSIVRGDLTTQKIAVYGQLASFWRDSAHIIPPYLWYQGEKAKLENTPKTLTFAAQSYMDELKSDQDPNTKSWMAEQARGLFDNLLQLEPNNDSAKIGWGSTFIFGAGGSASPMEGIMKIREVAQRDTTNMYAQFMLGYGAMMTGQYEKAIERLNTVARREPNNTEGIFLLAEAYERFGDKPNAIKWYKTGKKNVFSKELLEAIDEKINQLNH